MRYFLGFIFALGLAKSASAAAIGVTEKWGGKGISISVYSNGQTSVTFDCGTGSIAKFAVKNGVMRSAGTVRSGSGARPRPGQIFVSQPATYSATVSKNRMNLVVKSGGNRDEYSLTKGAQGDLFRCM